MRIWKKLKDTVSNFFVNAANALLKMSVLQNTQKCVF